MKIDEVPQDEGSCYEGGRRAVYAVGEGGEYAVVPSIGWRPEIDATAVSIDAANDRIRDAWQRARAGETSPLPYHMEAARMELAMLASEAGVFRWRVKRHFRPAVFPKLKPALLARYADVLAIPVDRLRQVPDQPELL